MGKILLTCVIISMASLLHAAEVGLIKNCKISNFDAVNFDNTLRGLINLSLNSFGSSKISDFDEKECLTDINNKGSVILLHFGQVNKKLIGHKNDLYVGYDQVNKKSVILLLNDLDQSFILRNDSDEVFNILKNTNVFSSNFKKFNFNSTLTFSNYGGESLNSENYEEKIKNDLEENNKKFINNAIANIKKSKDKDIIKSDVSYKVLLEDGEGKKVNVDVFIKLDKDLPIPLFKKDLLKNINFTSELIKLGLKNPYSYKPREILIEQEGVALKVIIRYTGTNSYGGQVVDIDRRYFYLANDGKYNPK